MLIEGHEDTLLTYVKAKPVFMWGDNTVQTFVSADQSPMKPADNQMAFFTGVDDPLMTR